MKLRKPTPDPPRPRILPGPGSSPAPDPPRPRILPGPGSSPALEPPWDRVSPAGSAPARSWGRAPDRGFVVVLITGPVRVLVPVPVLSFASVLHAGAGCAPARGRRRESLRARSRRESGVPGALPGVEAVSGPDPGGSPDTASPLVRAAAPELPGKRPRESRRGCHLDPRRPQGVRTRSVRVGPGAAVADADRAQGECGPGKVVQRAHGGALLFGQLAFRWTTAVRPSFSSAKCTSRRPGRGGVGRRGPRDRRVTREIVT